MMRFRRIVPIFLMLLFLLAACGVPGETQPPKVNYTVTYLVGEQVYQTQTVEEGSCPAAVTAEIDGLTFLGWQDADGQSVMPETLAVTGNISYVAQVRPRLSKHEPYLQTDEYGFLRPDAELTGEELRYALEALAEEGAKAYFPELPTGQTVTGVQLRLVLESFFDTAAVSAAVPDSEQITRAQLAQAMHMLLGRDAAETFILGAGAEAPMDVTALRTDAAALLEASMRHTADPAGICWADIELNSGWDPGFHNEDGWLYYVQEDGQLLRDGKVGDLYFGADGRYTSGDAELDALVVEILDTIIRENPELEGLDLLRKVYDHCHQDYVYLRKAAYEFGATGWEIEDAKEMFTSGRGNCYNYAAIFWALARGMGYEAYCLSGTCTGTDQPHGWVVMEIDGADYFFDPEWQYAYTERGVFDKDMFMLSMDEVWWWTYRWADGAF